jgi:hypothetical protein
MDEYFLSAENPQATTDQRELEGKALRLLERPELRKARTMAAYLWREVAEHPISDQMSRFESMMDEYMFHYALRSVASDAAHPQLIRFMAHSGHWFGLDVPGSRWGGDSPDFVYRIIPVAHGARYEICGRTTCEVAPTVNYALMADNTAAPSILGLLDGLDVRTRESGEFTITVDASSTDGRTNHIQTQPGAFQIWIRDALGDWLGQTPNALRVRRFDAPERAPLTDEELVQRAVRSLLDGVYYAIYIGQSGSGQPPNVMRAPASSGPFGGMATQYTSKAHICPGDDEAMIITASSAGALFRNAVLHDLFMLSVDYWSRTGSLNMAQAAADDDGYYTYVVAHQDPGVHNWLDTGGLRRTIFGHRWQSFPRDGARETPTIAARVVKFWELESALPRGVKRIDGAGRRNQIAQREAGVRGRFVDH